MILTAIWRLERFRNLLPPDVDAIAKGEIEDGSQCSRGQAIKLSFTDNEFLFAFWTILQLERYSKMRFYQSISLMRRSDITAELPCVHSGILQYEGIMPYPDYNLAVLGGMEEDVYRSYIDQLYMRKHLNWLQKELYKSRDKSQFLPVLGNKHDTGADTPLYTRLQITSPPQRGCQ